ncbi:UBX domain-containing protein 8 [Magnaporthiopsis poae ATCC 64411]|uniref:UBX domain-containing protein 8 n=1 Tax=Magnaporthiopsis poae (strain ATCC 64411 / 73-15) TaxID=644358 RepID=A0A0C4ECD7_MAGP6|nr:UBX domain-containing protein 8 [Magnaporthiopsis poae ATCC 64411]
MAEDSEVDLSALSDSQQEALQQYTMITDQDMKDAVPILQRSQWNAQIAIAKFFDGEGPDPLAAAIAEREAYNSVPVVPPNGTVRWESLQDSLEGYDSPDGHIHRTEAAPRVVPQPTTTYRPPFLLSFVMAPFNIVYRLSRILFRTVFHLLSFIPRPLLPRALGAALTKSTYGRRQLMPRDSAARFKREMEETYGAHDLPWFDGGSAQAYDLAKRELKFLLIVLLSPEHDDTDTFVREVLLAPEVMAYLKEPSNNIILWGGNVLDSEAYQVANEYKCTMFPFSCLVCLTPKEGSTRMGTIKRSVGPTTAERFLAGLRTAIGKHAPDLDGVRAERVAQAAARSLREDQDSAYERSLAKDREKARLRRQQEAEAAAAEKRALEEAEAAARRAEARSQWKAWRATMIAPEPPVGDGKDVVRLALMMPEHTGAGRIVRRFAAHTTIEELYAFVECYGVEGSEKAPLEPPANYKHEYEFRLVSVLPREVYEPSETETVGKKIGRSGNLIVEAAVFDSDDE